MRKKDRDQYTEFTDWQLAIMYQDTHDNTAIEMLMIRYENYIHKVASSYYWRTSLDNNDILSEAKIGFMEGVKRYNADGYFMYFTGMWMKVYIFVAIDTTSRLIRIPVNRLKDMRKIDVITAQSPYEYFSSEEIAEKTGIPIDKVTKYLFTDNKISNIENHYTLEDDNLEGIYSMFDKVDLKHDLYTILATLNETEYYIITRLYGLFGENKMDKDTIGENLKVSSERIRQIKDRVIRNFRHSKYSSLLVQYLN